MEFGQYLKELRKSKKIGVNQLALKSGVSASQISRIESGKRKEPKIETIEKLSLALDVSMDEMLTVLNKGISLKSSDPYWELNNSEKKDIALQADMLLDGIETGDSLNFYGEPATEEQKERIRVALKTAMEMNKEEAKKKFTRKDYRN
ncbi:helix-turn-helix domain-containing protein [Carnobacterium maltaromaticum]|uniref:helix-turn-helix domain-containing protein n=1 Tax=Carnobacterium maltaromaticum TaxID=2751 RepID=UPI0039BEAE10